MNKKVSYLIGIILSIIMFLPTISMAADYSGTLYYFTSKYGKNGSYTRIDLSTMAEDPLGFKGDDWTVSTNGRYLIYQGRENKFHSYDLQTRTDLELPSDWAYNSSPSSVSAHLFGFIRQDSNLKNSLYLKSVLDGKEKQMKHILPEGVRYRADIAFIPPLGKGTPFIISYGDKIYRVDSNSSTVIYTAQNKADNLRYPSVSPDGTRMAFVSDLNPGLWIMNTDGSNLTRLLDGDCKYTTWSPDGKFIAFTSASGAVRGNLYSDSVSGKSYRGAGGFTHKVWIVGVDGDEPELVSGADGKGVSVMGRIVWR